MRKFEYNVALSFQGFAINWMFNSKLPVLFYSLFSFSSCSRQKEISASLKTTDSGDWSEYLFGNIFIIHISVLFNRWDHDFVFDSTLRLPLPYLPTKELAAKNIADYSETKRWLGHLEWKVSPHIDIEKKLLRYWVSNQSFFSEKQALNHSLCLSFSPTLMTNDSIWLFLANVIWFVKIVFVFCPKGKTSEVVF